MIPVTKSFLPPREDYERILSRAWDSRWLTNRGPLATELETKLKAYLETPNLLYMANGTLALQVMLRAFVGIGAEIITTPFSYVATVSSAIWEGCSVVFADVDPLTGNIDPEDVKRKITPKTKAVLATHVYGNPCRVDELEGIGKAHGLKILYDAAHAFGVKIAGQAILNYGDASILSLHATKIFHTVEGGALICKDTELHDRSYHLHNFGHKGPEEFVGLGINAKASEFHAAMGLAILPYFEKIKARRREISDLYKAHLQDSVRYPVVSAQCVYNYAYFPIFLRDEKHLLRVREALHAKEIFPRRYFYPSLNHLPYVDKQSTPVSEDLSSRVLCLPLYYDLDDSVVEKIAEIVVSAKY